MCVVSYQQVDVQPPRHCAALLKLSEWLPVSAAPPHEPHDVSALLSWGCSSHDEAPSCSTRHTHGQTWFYSLIS